MKSLFFTKQTATNKKVQKINWAKDPKEGQLIRDKDIHPSCGLPEDAHTRVSSSVT